MSTEKISKIEKYKYVGKVYNVEVEPNHPTADDQYYVNAENGIVVHNCHPRDNIALRYLAEKLDLGYDLFDAIMTAREVQAENLAKFIAVHAQDNDLPVYIHGKAYKPNVSYIDGSYSLLVGHYLTQMGVTPKYIDPCTMDFVNGPVVGVILMAHDTNVTYGYTANATAQKVYCDIASGSVVIDPWRKFETTVAGVQVIHYGNTRLQ